MAAACSPRLIEYIGYSGTGSFTQSGGTNSVSGSLYLGYNSGSSGTYNLSGSGLLSAPSEYIGYSGTGSFTQSGGTNTISGSLVLGQNAGSTGTYNLNGGLLSLSGLTQGAGSATFNFSGGTLQAGSTFSTSVPIVLSTAEATYYDTNGNTLTALRSHRTRRPFPARRLSEDWLRHVGSLRHEHLQRHNAAGRLARFPIPATWASGGSGESGQWQHRLARLGRRRATHGPHRPV